MRFLLDTNVVSGMYAERVNPGVAQWLTDAVGARVELFLSVITLA